MPLRRQCTIEWQVCGVCNYDCSYCIQKKKHRVGHPSSHEVERFLQFFQELPGVWEIKMTGGEPFAFKGYMERIIPGLVERTPHRISTLTNLSAPLGILERFAQLTRGRLGIVSASLHLEHISAEEFAAKAWQLRQWMDPQARLVVNSVLVPGRMDAISQARQVVEEHGLKFFPQWMKVGKGKVEYSPEETTAVEALLGFLPDPTKANLAPSYRGKRCWAGADYFVVLQNGDAFSCRTARRYQEGYLGNVLAGTVQRKTAALPCPYDICPCTTPANRGMIEGVPE